MWFIDEDVLEPGSTYFLYGVSLDGMAASLSAKMTVTTPVKYTAIQRSIFADLGEPPPGNTTEPGLRNGVIAGFRIRPKTAADYAIGGFTQQGVWAGVSGKSSTHEWIETGVSQGFQGANLHTYVTAYGDKVNDIYVEISYSGSAPVTGNLEYFKIVQCSQVGTLVEFGCGTSASDKWVTCFDTAESGGALGDCIIWNDALVDQRAGESTGVNISHGMADMHIGFEATTSTSSIDTVYVKRIRYRLELPSQLVWSNIYNIPWQRTFLAKQPSPSSIHGTDCCQGLITSPGSTGAECAGPKDFIYFFNSSTPTTTSQCN
ncbi:MAG: hypothetical protein GY937_17560 [bacterium]|nr:hypothetical protein [bacterium]